MKAVSFLFILLLAATTASAQNPPSSITFFNDTALRRAIQTAPAHPGERGLYALRLSPVSEPEVVGIRRTAAAKAEQHANFTDVWYVIEGEATLVTGGSLQESTEIAPGEARATGIANGHSRQIQGGDYAVIPAGTPHWISSVKGAQLLYIVVKVPVVQNPPHH